VESPKKGLLKHYKVTLAREFTDAQREELLKGVMLKGERREVVAREIETDGESVIIAIGEGLYHQVRRMFAAVGNHVETLERISIGNLKLDPTLGRGGWRFLTDEEISQF
jgi:16S rRNA pseudouridine516 synthase